MSAKAGTTVTAARIGVHTHPTGDFRICARCGRENEVKSSRKGKSAYGCLDCRLTDPHFFKPYRTDLP